MSAALNSPLVFQPQSTQEQLLAYINQQVVNTMQQIDQQRLADDQAAQQAAQPAHTPAFLKAVEVETKLIDSAIRNNPTLSKRFGDYNLDQAIHGDGGPALQQLAHRIDDHVAKSAGFGSDKDTPLSDQAAVTKAVREGSRHFASLDMSAEDGTKFATEVAEGHQSPGSSEVSGEVDYDREGPVDDTNIDDVNPKDVEAHYKSAMEGMGHQFQPEETTILSMSDSFDDSKLHGDPDVG